jgi:hypothetical protein
MYLCMYVYFNLSVFYWGCEVCESSSTYECPHCWSTGYPYELHIRRTGRNPPCGPSAGWWVLTTANAAGTDGLTCLPKHGGARDNKFLVTHPMTDQRCLSSAIHLQGHRAPRSSASCARISKLSCITYLIIILQLYWKLQYLDKDQSCSGGQGLSKNYPLANITWEVREIRLRLKTSERISLGARFIFGFMAFLTRLSDFS